MAQTTMEWRSAAPLDAPVGQVDFARVADALAISIANGDAVGFWDATLPVEAGRAYRIRAVASHDLDPPGTDLGVILSWRRAAPAGGGGADKIRYIQRDYLSYSDDGALRRFDDLRVAPAEAVGVDLRLYLRWRKATARFGGFSFEPATAPGPRNVRIAATHVLPPKDADMEGNRALVAGLLERIGKETRGVDLVVLPEAIAGRGVALPAAKRAEAIPDGPFCRMLAERARELNAYVCASIHENDGGRIYNTAFLLDRRGGLVGKYRKVHLTMGEMETGIQPGDGFKVFDTDFGKVGLLICWDNFFPESARVLRLLGAELLVFPIAGIAPEMNWRTLWPARALENGIPFVAGITNPNNPAAIVERDGNFVALTMKDVDYVTGVVDLNQRNRIFWLSVGPALGDPYDIYLHERRRISYGPLVR